MLYHNTYLYLYVLLRIYKTRPLDHFINIYIILNIHFIRRGNIICCLRVILADLTKFRNSIKYRADIVTTAKSVPVPQVILPIHIGCTILCSRVSIMYSIVLSHSYNRKYYYNIPIA